MVLPTVRNPYLERTVLNDVDFVDQVRNMRPALERFIHENDVKQLIHAIVDDPETLQSVAGCSYSHLNGFEKIVLMGGEDDSCVVRLNVWLPETDRSEEDVHDHTKSFSSVILCGALRIRHYEISANGELLHQYLARPPSRGGMDSLSEVGSVRVDELFCADIPQGTFYTLDHRQLHTVSPLPGLLTATLLFQTRNLKPDPRVLRSLPRKESMARRWHSLDFLSATLRRVAAAV